MFTTPTLKKVWDKTKWEEIQKSIKSDAWKLTVFDAILLGLVLIRIILGVISDDPEIGNLFNQLVEFSKQLVSALVSTGLAENATETTQSILLCAIVLTIVLGFLSPLIFNLGISIVLLKEVTPTMNGVRLYLDVLWCHLITIIYVGLDYFALKVDFTDEDFSLKLSLSLTVLRILLFICVCKFWKTRWDRLEMSNVKSGLKSETV